MDKRAVIGLLGILCTAFGTTVFGTSIRDNVVLPQFYQSAIDELFRKQAPQVTSSYLYDSQNHTFEVMVESQSYLYWKYAAQNQENSMYLRNLAYFIREIRRDTRYNSISSEAKQRLDAVATHLPSSLQHLLLKPHFCLLSQLYSEFAYLATTAFAVDEDRNYVFTSGSKNYIDYRGHWVSFTESEFQSNSGYLEMMVALKAVDMFMYREEQHVNGLNNLIIGRRSDEPPPSSFWSVELVEGKFLVFSQNGYLMCQPGDTHTATRRYIYALNNSFTKNSPECQWIAKDCP